MSYLNVKFIVVNDAATFRLRHFLMKDCII